MSRRAVSPEEARAIEPAIAREIGLQKRHRTMRRDGQMTRVEIDRAVARACGIPLPKKNYRTEPVCVWASVSYRDVLVGHSPEALSALAEKVLPLVEYVSGLSSTPERELVFGLCAPHFGDKAEEDDWSAGFINEGVHPDWLDKIAKLRVRNHPAFCEVFDVEGAAGSLGTYWHADDAGACARRSPHKASEAPRVGTYTLPLVVNVPVAGGRETSQPVVPERPASVPVRPYPSCGADMDPVSALAEHLAPRLDLTFNGRERLQRHPVFAPLCAMCSTVWAAMLHPVCRTRHDAPRPRAAAFHACLDALDLGPHRETADRILRRDHPRHISIDAGVPGAPRLPEGRRGLALFAARKDGNLVEVTDQNSHRFEPRILRCLVGPEPL